MGNECMRYVHLVDFEETATKEQITLLSTLEAKTDRKARMFRKS